MPSERAKSAQPPGVEGDGDVELLIGLPVGLLVDVDVDGDGGCDDELDPLPEPPPQPQQAWFAVSPPFAYPSP